MSTNENSVCLPARGNVRRMRAFVTKSFLELEWLSEMDLSTSLLNTDMCFEVLAFRRAVVFVLCRNGEGADYGCDLSRSAAVALQAGTRGK